MPTFMLHDSTFQMEYATLEAREASFAPPSKRSKAGGWPHKTPKAVDLARAGFYFKPSAQSNDNAVCFMCSRNLDGWEKDDDPVEEHLKHAEDCGWAVMMNIEAQKHENVSEMEDPTDERITEARRATFGMGWPHESKRGWTCKIEKMVEGGWHFAPTTESEDYVSCAYCKLSLDGWEPKDSPFDEHHSRSPDCPFFTFAGTTAPSKRPKAKKGRASRTSRVSRSSTRLSTQSNMTFQSEVEDIPDLNESLDTSNVSIQSSASTAATKGKGKRKATASRTKTTKTKKAKTTKSKKKDNIEPEAEDEEQPKQEEEATHPATQASLDDEVQEKKPRPRAKRTKAKKEPEEVPIEPPLSPVESLGPPEQEASMIPVLASSPIPAIASHKKLVTSAIPSPQAVESALHQAKTIAAIRPSAPTPVSPQASTSDIENDPPSTRPKSARPPISSPGTIPSQWTPIDVEMVFESTPAADLVANHTLSDAERQMTVQDWVKFIAGKAEEDLRNEGERVVGIFETQGQKALSVLESVVCV